MRLITAALAALALACCAVSAAAQSIVSLSVRDSTGATRLIAGQADVSGLFHYRDVMEGLNGSTPTAWSMDGSGAGAVNVATSALPTGASTAANQATMIASLASLTSNTAARGLGSMAAVPAGSTNGAALGSLPAGAKGAKLYLAAGDAVTFTIATTAPASAPTATFTVSGTTTGSGATWEEALTGGAMIYVTAVSGSPKFRWF